MFNYLMKLFIYLTIIMVTGSVLAYGLELKRGSMDNGTQIHRNHAGTRTPIMPKSNYKLPPINRNFQPHITIPNPSNIPSNLGTITAHRAWCQNRYKDYRIMDNSFKNRGGIRQPCISPYSQ